MAGPDRGQDFGTVRRTYEYLRDAANDIERAQKEGWKVMHVFIEGKRLEPTRSSSWLKELWSPRLVLDASGRVHLHRQPAFLSGRGRHEAGVALTTGEVGFQPSDGVEVTYAR